MPRFRFFWPGPTFVSPMADVSREREREFSSTKTRGKKSFLLDEIVHTSRRDLAPHKILNNGSPLTACVHTRTCVHTHAYVCVHRNSNTKVVNAVENDKSNSYFYRRCCNSMPLYKRLTFTVDCSLFSK